MSKPPVRTIKMFRYAMFCDGIDDYVVIEPFIVYGWSEITIEELIYPYYPKANNLWSRFSMIGDYWTDYPSTFHEADNRYDYTKLVVFWVVRKPDGTRGFYVYNFYGYRNTWVHLIRRFTQDRKYNVWINSESKYSATVPSDEKTVLEWNPDTATYPERYKRFVLGANTVFSDHMKVSYYILRIYSRALTDDDIRNNYSNPYNPVRDGLKVYLLAHPDYVKDIDNDGILEWIDLSGNNNHGKIYNAELVELTKSSLTIKTPVRVLPRVR